MSMKRGDALLLAQLINTMQELLVKIEEAQRKKDSEQFERAKKEFISLSNQADALL